MASQHDNQVNSIRFYSIQLNSFKHFLCNKFFLFKCFLQHLLEVDQRLRKFAGYFICIYEKYLSEYYERLENQVKKPGKWASLFTGITDISKGGTEAINVPEWKAASISIISLLQIMVSGIGAEINRNNLKKLMDQLYEFKENPDEVRKKLVRSSIDIFRSFESQFAHATADGNWQRAMAKLAHDAVNRVINYYKENINEELSSLAITKGTILGKSKKHATLSLTKGHTLRGNFPQSTDLKSWNTAELFEKTGLVIADSSGKTSNYYSKKGNDVEKYGFRLLFEWEEHEVKRPSDKKLVIGDKEYTENEVPKDEYKYILTKEKLEEKEKEILSDINNQDPKLMEKRFEEATKEIKEAIEDINESLNDCFKELESSMDNNQEETKKYFNEVIQELQNAKQERQQIAKSIEEGKEENRENFEEASKERKKGYEKIIDEIRSVKVPKQESTIWFNVREPVESFTGRTKELEKLHKLVQRGQSTVITQTTSISGLGGIGKSELVRMYAQKYSQYYDNNFIWINAESYATVVESFHRLAQDELGISIKNIDGTERDIKSIIKDAYKSFAKRKSLFIFDNAEKLEDDGVNEFLPFSCLSPDANKPYFIITSRNQKWGDIQVLQLDIFTEEEAIEFIKKTLKIEDDLQNEEIKQLAEKLQYFPLALQQAVAYIKEKEIRISNYLKKYEEKAEDLLNFKFYEYIIDAYTKTTFVTWDITLDAIKQKEHGSLALKILNTMAYFVPDNIPAKVFLEFAEGDCEEELKSTIQLLKKYSMVSSEEEHTILNIHRLVQQVTRIKLKDQGNEEKTLGEILVNKNMEEVNLDHAVSVWNYASKYDNLIRRFIDHTYGKEKNCPLHWLAENGDKEAIENILGKLNESKLNRIANAKNTFGFIPLHIAAHKGYLQVVEVLVEHKADIKTFDNFSRTPLHRAVGSGRLDAVKYLVEHDADINTSDKIGWTPLHTASAIGSLDVVKYLVELGADIKTPNKDGWTPLHRAAASGSFNVVKYLIEQGADFKTPDKDGSTPLHKAAASGSFNVVKYLIEQGANTKATDKFSRTPLHRAVASGRLDVVEYLVKKGADIKIPDKFSQTPLHRAAASGSFNVVKYLVDSDADIKTTDKDGSTPLHRAAASGRLDVVKYLVEHGADIKTPNKNGSTPLHIAITSGILDVVKYFLELDADIKTKENYSTLLHRVTGSCSLDVVRYLVELGADFKTPNKNGSTLLHRAADSGSLDVVKYLVELGIDIKTTDKEGSTPLHRAVASGRLDVVKYLVKKGADIKIPKINGSTLLHIAADSGSLDVVKYLVESDADIKTTDKDGSTPLHRAAASGSFNVVKYFVEQGADTKATDKFSWTPLHRAADNGRLNVVKYLVELGADFKTPNQFGSTPLQIATASSKSDVVKYLEEKAANI